jgi:hypothetical protein
MAFTSKPTPAWMVDSKLLPYAIDTSDLLATLAPRPVKDAFRDSMRDIRMAWDQQLKKRPRQGSGLKKRAD